MRDRASGRHDLRIREGWIMPDVLDEETEEEVLVRIQVWAEMERSLGTVDRAQFLKEVSRRLDLLHENVIKLRKRANAMPNASLAMQRRSEQGLIVQECYPPKAPNVLVKILTSPLRLLWHILRFLVLG
jgi:hypothetical protein